MVPVADCQALCLEQNAGLAIVGDAQRAVGPHQRLEQLPLVVIHPQLVPVKRLRTQENGSGCESRKVNTGNAFIHPHSGNVALLIQGPGKLPLPAYILHWRGIWANPALVYKPYRHISGSYSPRQVKILWKAIQAHNFCYIQQPFIRRVSAGRASLWSRCSLCLDESADAAEEFFFCQSVSRVRFCTLAYQYSFY